MKKALLFVAFVVATCSGIIAQNNVTLHITHKLGNNSFGFNEGAINSMGHDFEVTRLEYYISEITLVHDGGNETVIEDFWILVDAGESANYELGSYDVTQIEAIKLHVGVDPDHNHTDPATYASDHPLAPQFPSMHWGWSAGYRFVAYEGNGGANFNQLFELHGLEDPNYFETTIDLSASADKGEMILVIDADYSQGLRDIALDSGVIIHGGYGAAKKCLENFRDYVFSESGTVVSVEQQDFAISMRLFPNPCTAGISRLYLSPTNASRFDVVVNDVMGKEIISFRQLQGKQSLDLLLESAGMYFVSVTRESGAINTMKVIAQ